MYFNLKAEMVRRNMTGGELAEIIGINSSTFSAKLNGKYDFTLAEALAIKKALKTEVSIEELFAFD